MWKPVTKNGESLGLTAKTVGELKEMLKYVPDDYLLSVQGTIFGMVVDNEYKTVLFDDVEFLEILIEENEEENEEK